MAHYIDVSIVVLTLFASLLDEVLAVCWRVRLLEDFVDFLESETFGFRHKEVNHCHFKYVPNAEDDIYCRKGMAMICVKWWDKA